MPFFVQPRAELPVPGLDATMLAVITTAPLLPSGVASVVIVIVLLVTLVLPRFCMWR
jgi:hypothetical protein